MSYEIFCRRVIAIANRVGYKVNFSREDGKHVARCDDGVTIIGNSECRSVLVKWGSGHTALTVI